MRATNSSLLLTGPADQRSTWYIGYPDYLFFRSLESADSSAKCFGQHKGKVHHKLH